MRKLRVALNIVGFCVVVVGSTPSALAEVQLILEHTGSSVIEDDFYVESYWNDHFPLTLDVRLVSDRSINKLSWDWAVEASEPSSAWMADLMEFRSDVIIPPTSPFAFGTHTSSAADGIALNEAGPESFLRTFGPLIGAQDVVIAQYVIDADWPLMFDGNLTIDLISDELPLQWTDISSGASGTPDVTPFHLVNIGPEPTSALLLVLGGALLRRTRDHHRSS